MLINTHMLMGRKIYENMDYDKKALLKETQFIWGNIKPDCALKYKLMKHYKDESFLMIINKIEFLSNLSIKVPDSFIFPITTALYIFLKLLTLICSLNLEAALLVLAKTIIPPTGLSSL